VFVLPCPPLAWPVLVAIGTTLFAGQFLLQFFAIAHGLPPGLASLLVQTQALFTILFAVIAFRETPTRRQLSGVALSFAGLVLILFTVDHDLTIVGFFLALGSAISWGVGNILLKHTDDVDARPDRVAEPGAAGAGAGALAGPGRSLRARRRDR
jgi:O-acetylserine/cysteine efflux transporter